MAMVFELAEVGCGARGTGILGMRRESELGKRRKRADSNKGVAPVCGSE